MTKEELLKLEIEKRSLLATIDQFSKQDERMNTKIDDLCKKFEDRVKEIQKIIDENI